MTRDTIERDIDARTPVRRFQDDRARTSRGRARALDVADGARGMADAVDASTPLLRRRRPATATVATAATAATAAILATCACWGVGARVGGRALPSLGVVGAENAVGVEGGESDATKYAVLQTQCLLVCGSEGDGAAKTLTDLSMEAGGRAPTCDELRAVTAADSCYANKCTCMEKAMYTKEIDLICATGETTMDAIESSAFSKQEFEAGRDACPQEFAQTNERATVNNASQLGVPLYASPKLGNKHTWVPRKGQLLARAPRQNELVGAKTPTTFKLYTQCKPDHVKKLGGEFWFESLAGAYLVRHNYGSRSFFKKDKRLRMQRAELEDGVYGYTLTTDQVDWEYGFELENSNGNTFLEIGKVNKHHPTLLQRESCAQRYGEYFNRVLTTEENPNTVSYVFGNCTTECPSDYVDSAFCVQPLTDVIAPTESEAFDIGELVDARLANFASALLYASSTSVLHLQGGRTYVVRYNSGTKSQQDWIVGISDRERTLVKMARIRVKRDEITGTGKVWRLETRKYTLRRNAGYAYEDWNSPSGYGCMKQYCDVARYPLPSFWDQSSPNSGGDYRVMRIEYTKLDLGDAPPQQFTVSLDERPLSPSVPKQLLAPGTWGEDLDVRRVILRSGTICGSWINYKNCMFANAVPVNPKHWDDYNGPTKNIKQWLILTMDGYFKGQRIEVTVGTDGGVYARAIEARYISRSYDPDDPSTFDPLAYDLSEQMSKSTSRANIAEGYDDGGYGTGAITFHLAAEMSASLRGVSC